MVTVLPFSTHVHFQLINGNLSSDVANSFCFVVFPPRKQKGLFKKSSIWSDQRSNKIECDADTRQSASELNFQKPQILKGAKFSLNYKEFAFIVYIININFPHYTSKFEVHFLLSIWTISQQN